MEIKTIQTEADGHSAFFFFFKITHQGNHGVAVKRQRQFGIHSQLLSKALKSEAKHDNDVKVVKKPEDTTGLQPALFSSLRIALKKKKKNRKIPFLKHSMVILF